VAKGCKKFLNDGRGQGARFSRQYFYLQRIGCGEGTIDQAPLIVGILLAVVSPAALSSAGEWPRKSAAERVTLLPGVAEVFEKTCRSLARPQTTPILFFERKEEINPLAANFLTW
jgi:hypothetical protein